MLHRLLYCSRLDRAADPDLASILATSDRNNRTVGIGGVLIAEDLAIIQILEGPLDPLESTFERICRDLRHSKLRILEFAPLPQRSFGPPGLRRIMTTAATRLLVQALHADDDLRAALSTSEAAMQLLRVVTQVEDRGLPTPARKDRIDLKQAG